jgi:hypothetical protein
MQLARRSVRRTEVIVKLIKDDYQQPYIASIFFEAESTEADVITNSIGTLSVTPKNVSVRYMWSPAGVQWFAKVQGPCTPGSRQKTGTVQVWGPADAPDWFSAAVEEHAPPEWAAARDIQRSES